MIRIRYLTLLMLLFVGSTSLWAQDDEPFNPSSPAEPGPPGGGVPMLTLVADPVDGGTVSGAGWYNAGAQVTLRAYNNANFVFDRWADAEGNTVSTSAQFKYTKKEADETLTAYFRFSPGSPAEPTEIAQLIYHQLTLIAEEGGSVSGGGKYLPNTRVYLSASLNTGYVFNGWYDDDGTLVSTSQSFYYVTLAKPVTLTARFRFNPGSPSEPTEPNIIPKHILTVTAEEGGTVNTGGSEMKEGATTTLTATANAGYVFRGWYKGDELYNANRSFTFTMGTEDVSLVARFTFNPSSPGDPSKPDTHKYAFYLMNKVTKPGTSIQYPVYLTSLDPLNDITFQLTFPNELVPDMTTVQMSEKAEGYTVEVTAIDEATYTLTLTGGEVSDGNAALLVFTVNVPADIATAQNYQVKINQVTVTEADGNVTTASTRNGRISVYKLGDSNGDDVVNALDVLNIAKVAVNRKTEVFIQEVSDINEDDGINALDVLGVVKIAVNKE